jgi:hypothetical protein
MEHGSSFRGLNLFRQIIIDVGKPSTEYKNGFIALSFQGIELNKL